MPFDPSKPVNGVLIDADFLRGQFNALNDKIEAVPASDMAAFLARLSAILRLNFTGPHVPNNPYAAGDVASFNDVVVRFESADFLPDSVAVDFDPD